VTGAFIFITLGVLILLNNLFPAQFGFERTWPVILIVIGTVKIVEHIGRSLQPRRRDGDPPTRPGREGA
jgi:hypothetical protein